MSIQQKDWVIGEVYRCYSSSYDKIKWLFLWNNGLDSPSINIENDDYEKDERMFKGTCSTNRVELATPSEKAWLLKCIEADKYLPFEEIVTEPFYIIY